jgi:hypothetical protein
MGVFLPAVVFSLDENARPMTSIYDLNYQYFTRFPNFLLLCVGLVFLFAPYKLLANKCRR